MIVLDEQLSDLTIVRDFAGWYRGAVVNITDLRPATIIRDDAVPLLLRRVSQPTFVTLDYEDFWRVAAARSYYCILCLKLSQLRVERCSAIILMCSTPFGIIGIFTRLPIYEITREPLCSTPFGIIGIFTIRYRADDLAANH